MANRNSHHHHSQSSSSWIKGKCIGRGSFGTVNIGVSKSDDAVFAVKSVDLATCLPAQAESLENEIRFLRSLSSSPYVVKYLNDDHSASYRNLHIEYLPGGTVVDNYADVDDDDESVIRSRTWCLVSALKYVHSKGIVHCDVKGKNVLVGPTKGEAKLSDFGSSIFMEDGCTGRIAPRGSPLWMAPEVVRGEYQGPESDVWSLGCTVVEMVTGKPAWDDDGLVETLSRIGFSSGGLPELPTRLSETGRDFVDKCLRRDRMERWSCDQLLRHPFLASVAPTAAPEDCSPRCVLDWVNSEFEEEEYSSSSSSREESAKERIGKLASWSGAEWEFSEDEDEYEWTVVRDYCVAAAAESAAFPREEETSSGYSDCEGAVSEKSESCGGGDLVEWARSQCERVGASSWYGSLVVEYFAVDRWRRSVGIRKSLISYGKLCRISYSLGIFINKLLIFIICYILITFRVWLVLVIFTNMVGVPYKNIFGTKISQLGLLRV